LAVHSTASHFVDSCLSSTQFKIVSVT